MRVILQIQYGLYRVLDLLNLYPDCQSTVVFMIFYESICMHSSKTIHQIGVIFVAQFGFQRVLDLLKDMNLEYVFKIFQQ